MRREKSGAAPEHRATNDWCQYVYRDASTRNRTDSHTIVSSMKWNLNLEDWVKVPSLQALDEGASGVAYHKSIMPNGEGAERMVHH